jgi:putative DNA primase/helicase
MSDTTEILKGLETLAAGQVFEIRATRDGASPHTRLFAPDDVQSATEWAAGLSGKVKGIYVTLNPLKPELLARGGSAKDVDVLKRRWLPIDLDPEREDKNVSATDDEKKAALERAITVCEYLTAQGWLEPVVMDSGNGYWLLYAIDIPADDGGNDGLVHRCLKALAAKFNCDRVKIDTRVYNASRIAKLPGTLAAKGPNTADRPHRVAALLEVPINLVPVPREKLEELAARPSQQEPAEETPQEQEDASVPPATENPQEQAPAAAPAADRPQEQDYAPLEDRVARAEAYVAKMDPAISGKHGHDQTYHVAALLMRDFALPEADALPIIEEFNKRCQPPWPHEELVRKLHEADKKEGPRGSKARETSPEKLADAWRYLKRPDGRYYGPNGMRKREHEELSRILVISFDLPTWEALKLLRYYNETHGNLPERRLQEIVHEADKLDRLRGKKWPWKPREDPYRLALELIDERHWKERQSTLRRHSGCWWAWDGKRYCLVPEGDMKDRVAAFVQKEFNKDQEIWARCVADRRDPLDDPELKRFNETVQKGEEVVLCDAALLSALAPLEPGRYQLFRKQAQGAGISATALDRAVQRLAKGVKSKTPPTPMPVTVHKVQDVMQQLRSLEHCRAPERMPAMLDGSEERYIAFENGLLNLETFDWRPHTPAWFSSVCLPYEYNADAPPPTQWLEFLHSVWGDDPESIATLQDWFGLVIAGDIRLEKILMLMGPTRSGKGTISTVLEGLIGKDAIAGLTLSHMATRFGLEGLIGKQLAIIPDARYDSKDGPRLVERLLSISGGDLLPIDLKGRPSVTTRLPTLLMLLTNEMPKITETSGALAKRFVMLKMTKSFTGEAEKVGLKDSLLTELPSILQWALEGWKRVRETRRLKQPESAKDLVQELLDTTSLVHAFVSERGQVGPEEKVAKETFFEAWREWCDRNYLTKYVGAPRTFGRMLKTAFPQIQTEGKLTLPTGERVNAYIGVGLKAASPRPVCPDSVLLAEAKQDALKV